MSTTQALRRPLWPMGSALLCLVGCGDWFQNESCAASATRCAGDRVQSCVVDEVRTRNAGKQINRWATGKTCRDDPQLGAFTCGVVQGRPTCVPQTADNSSDAGDGGTAGTAAPVWLRVEVGRDGRGMQIQQVKQFAISARPKDPAWGVVAAVSYRGTEIVDATLVPFPSEAVAASAWLRGEQADRIELVDETGQALATSMRQLPSYGERALGLRKSALESNIPATLKVVSLRYGKERPVTPAMLHVLDQALARVPAELLVLVTQMVLNLDIESEQMLGVAALTDAGTDAAPAEDDEESPLLGKRLVQRSARDGGRLWVDFSGHALREYQVDTSGLSFDIVQALGELYVDASDAVGVALMAGGTKLKFPPDFPANLVHHLTDQHSSLLAGGETVSTAWAALHNVACEGGLSTPYVPLGRIPPSDELAVQAGFAAAEGAKGPLADIVGYLVRANVPSLWASSPCESIRGVALDELSPSQLVHVTKLLALRGLDLLSAEALERCAGMLRASASANAIVMHKPDGERITFTDSLEGIRQPYFGSEVQMSWKAERAYVGLSLSVGYRGPMPSIVRLAPVGGHEGKDGRMEDDYAAVFAMTNPDGYQTGVAKGGLVVVSEVSPDVLEAYALMVLLSKEQAGSKVFPLVSARITSAKCTKDDPEKCPRLVWGDAP